MRCVSYYTYMYCVSVLIWGNYYYQFILKTPSPLVSLWGRAWYFRAVYSYYYHHFIRTLRVEINIPGRNVLTDTNDPVYKTWRTDFNSDAPRTILSNRKRRISHVRFTVTGNGLKFESSLRARHRRVTTHVSTKVRPMVVVVTATTICVTAPIYIFPVLFFFFLCDAMLMDCVWVRHLGQMYVQLCIG
jgi:hypothetical protein